MKKYKSTYKMSSKAYRDPREYTYIERELANFLKQIWNNRNAITNEDLKELEKYSNKGFYHV